MKPHADHPFGPRGLVYRARVQPSQIVYLCAITEAHEGLAVVRTRDQKQGLVEFHVSPLMRATFEDYIRALDLEMGVVLEEPVEATTLSD